MIHCRHCVHLAPERLTGNLQWEPIRWACALEHEINRFWEEVVVQPTRECSAFERDPGADDDLSGNP